MYRLVKIYKFSFDTDLNSVNLGEILNFYNNRSVGVFFLFLFKIFVGRRGISIVLNPVRTLYGVVTHSTFKF